MSAELTPQEEEPSYEIEETVWKVDFNKIPTVEARKKEAGLPTHVGMEKLAELEKFAIVYLSEVQYRPGFDGLPHETYFAGIVDASGNKYTTVFGGRALLPILENVQIPFVTSLRQTETQRGMNKAWVFVEPEDNHA